MSNTSKQMKEIMSRIKSRREQLGLSFQQLADLTHMSKSTLQRYETGGIKNIPLDKLEVLAQALQTTPLLLLGIDDDYIETHEYLQPLITPQTASQQVIERNEYEKQIIALCKHDKIDNLLPLPKTKKVPLVGTIACGTPILAEQNIEREILLPDMVKADFALWCKGSSMINAGIEDGDIAFIRCQNMVENGEIAAVQITNFDTEATLKKVYLTDTSITLVAQNPEVEPMTFVGEDMNRVEIVGKCVAVLKDFEK